MSIAISSDTLHMLVQQQPIIFAHMKTQMWWSLAAIVILSLVSYLAIGWLLRRGKTTTTEAQLLVQIVKWVFVALVVIWAIIRVQVYFGERAFERTPETYVLQHLR